MANRTVPAAAEGMSALTYPTPPAGAKPAVVAAWPTLGAFERKILTGFYALTPANQDAFSEALELMADEEEAAR